MTHLLKAEFYKLWRNKSFWGILSVSLLLGFVLILERSLPASSFECFYSSLYATPLLYFLIIIFGALFIGEDFTDRSLGAYINAGHSRSRIVFAKTFSYLLSSIVILTAPLLFNCALCFLISGNAGAFSITALFLKGAIIFFAICAMGMLPVLSAFLFQDVGKAMAVPMILYFLMILLLNSRFGEALAIYLPMGQLRLLSVPALPDSIEKMILFDLLWIALCALGVHTAFTHSDLK